MTTMVSSTNNPRDNNSEKKAIKLSGRWVVLITEKVIKKVSGIANEATIAWRIPKNKKRVKKTSAMVISKSRIRS